MLKTLNNLEEEDRMKNALVAAFILFSLFFCCWISYSAREAEGKSELAMSASVPGHVGQVAGEPQEIEAAPKVPALSAVDQKLEKLGFGNSADVHKINVTQQ